MDAPILNQGLCLSRRRMLTMFGSAGTVALLSACGGGGGSATTAATSQLTSAAVSPPPPAAAVVEPIPVLSPSSNWKGQAGSGGTAPADPPRSTGKPFLRPLFVPDTVFTGDVTLLFDAAAKGGIQRLSIWCEGNTVSTTTARFVSYTDVNGVARKIYGYAVTLKWADFNAIAASGTANIYVTAVPNDTSLQSRTIGPIAIHNRVDAVAGTRTVGATGADHPTIQSALDWISANAPTARNQRILIKSSGTYDLSSSVATFYNGATHWVTIEADTGVTATLTSGSSRTTARLHYDGLRFRGNGIVVDLGRLSAFVMESAGLGKLWFDGCRVIQSGGRNAVFDGAAPQTYWMQMSAGGTSRFYVTECSADDVYNGFSYCELVRNTSANKVAGDAFQNNKCVHGISADGLSPADPTGLRNHVAALDIRYTGSGVAKVAISGGPNISIGATRILQLYVNDSAVGAPVTITNPTVSPSGSGYTSWTQLAAAISAVPGFSAQANSAAGTRRAVSASKTGLTPTVDMAFGSGRELTFTNGAATITSIFDVHSDFAQYFGAHENVGGRFMTCKNLDSLNGGQGLFVDGTATSLADCWWRNIEIATNGNGVAATSQVLSSWSHAGLENSTFYDQAFRLRSDAAGASKFDPDARCQIRNCSFFTFAWGGTPDADLVIDRVNVRSGALPAGATNGTAVTGSLYANAPTDLSPTAGGGLQAGSTYIGARLPDGSWNV
jgi:hypothetical protein